MIREMQVTLKGPSGRKVLAYEIFSDRTSQLWARSLQSSIQTSSLKEKNRFYNFGDPKTELENLLKALAEVTQKLQKYYPALTFPELNLNDLQNSVNHLHFNFAHSHNVTKLVNSETNADWVQFNTLLHAVESVLHNEKLLKIFGLPGARIAFTWHEMQLCEIPDEGFARFELPFEFGMAYANFSQVGRQFLEMFLAKDDSLADEHIQPMAFVSGDTNLWLGPAFGAKWTASLTEMLHNWFKERETRFNRLGFYWGDVKLALGNLPVGRLRNPPVSQHEILDFIRKIGEGNEVFSVEVS